MVDESIRKEFEALKADVTRLREDIHDLTGALREAGVEKMSHAKAGLNEEFAKRKEKLRHSYREARNRGDEMMDEFGQDISEHPLSSLLISFGIGFIAAKIIDGCRH